jgi:dTDP-4-dehydrorhamnose reductase
MTKVAIYGAGGIIGQHMRLCEPDGLGVRYYRKNADFLHYGIDLTQPGEAIDWWGPDVILNLAGENRPDVVEQSPPSTYPINVQVPEMLAEWCDAHGAHYIHVSSQAVFSGEDPPYGPDSPLAPINAYGRQKAQAEQRVRKYKNWTIVRPTFVIGIRPLPHVGRQNPLEQMLANPTGPQVDDRWFSLLDAQQAAQKFWIIIEYAASGEYVRSMLHICSRLDSVLADRTDGLTLNRYTVALAAGCSPGNVSHVSFPGLAERPRDTTYKSSPDQETAYVPQMRSEISDCACEIALFLGCREDSVVIAREHLERGFIHLHQAVAASFNQYNPQTDEQILDWYRTTEAYIWELTAYHLDEGFNYQGMCDGIITHLQGCQAHKVLCVGDGVGTLTLRLRTAGIDAVYHDLVDSLTANFAQFRFWRQLGRVGDVLLSDGWEPNFPAAQFDAVICTDFLEHVTDVPQWVGAVFETLKPGGRALFQNAFGAGSGRTGSIPMHLARNDRYVTEYTSLMQQVGWKQIGTSNWWKRPDTAEQAA